MLGPDTPIEDSGRATRTFARTHRAQHLASAREFPGRASPGAPSRRNRGQRPAGWTPARRPDRVISVFSPYARRACTRIRARNSSSTLADGPPPVRRRHESPPHYYVRRARNSRDSRNSPRGGRCRSPSGRRGCAHNAMPDVDLRHRPRAGAARAHGSADRRIGKPCRARAARVALSVRDGVRRSSSA
jgi:hypothetical protein